MLWYQCVCVCYFKSNEMERRRRRVVACHGDDDSTEVTDPFQNRRLSQVVAQIFESNTCINELTTCEPCEEETESQKHEEIGTDFIDYKEEPKNKELFRETFREIEAFFKRESPIKVRVTDVDRERSSSLNTEASDETDVKSGSQYSDVNSEDNIPKRETTITESQSHVTRSRDGVLENRFPFRAFAKDCEFPSVGASSMQHTNSPKLQYSNFGARPMFTNSSIETTFGVTPPEQRSSLRSIRRSRSPDCKRVSPTYRWSVTSV